MFKEIEKKITSGKEISYENAAAIYIASHKHFLDLFASASRIREKFKGNKIVLCSIVSAKSGKCSEDCSCGAQSAHYKPGAPVYSMMNPKDIMQKAKEAYNAGASEFSVVTSGREISAETDLKKLTNSFEQFKESLNIPSCASLGTLTYERGKKLKEAGLTNYHHNLETAESFYDNICSTHSYKDRIETVKIAKSLGFKVCSGGIFGMGETEKLRIELAFALKELDVDSIPMNFLNPIKGTPLENVKPMTPLEILRLIGVYRLIHPMKDIIICGGREINLRSLQSMIFFAGANGTLMGNYLTTSGNSPEDDIQMIKDEGLIAESEDSNGH